MPGVVSIGSYAFANCESLTGISIPAGVREIKNFAFKDCKNLESVDVDPKNTYYSSQDGILFDKQKTKLLLYPAGKTSKYYKVPDSVQEIQGYSFEYGRPSALDIPASVKTIGEWAFHDCYDLTQVLLPDGLTSINVGLFGGCSSLSEVYIPASVTGISVFAFSGCDKLEKVYYGGSQSQWEAVSIGSVNDALLNAEIVCDSPPQSLTPIPMEIADMTVSDDAVSVTLDGTPQEGAFLFVTLWDADGKFLCAGCRDALFGTNSVAVSTKDAATVAAILTDADFAPLCPKLSRIRSASE